MMDTNPFEAVVSMQQTTLKQTQDAMTESMKAQTDIVNAVAENLETIERAQKQGTELSRETVLSTFDAIENVNPDADVEELRSSIEEQFDTFEESHEDQWDRLMELTEESLDGYEETADTYSEFVESSFEQFLDAHEEVGERAADATEKTIETTSEIADEATSAK
jgi:hypothetical protein